MKLPHLLFLFFLIFFSCNNADYEDLAPEEGIVVPITQRQQSPPEASENLPERKLIKDGSITLRTNDIQLAKKQMDKLVRQYGAEYGRENYEQLSSKFRYLLRVDVSSKRFDDFVDAVETSFDNVENKSIEVRDVTEEFLDLETRLESKEAYLKRYREILDKAENVEEILKIEREIRQIEEEIESVKGRLKYLSKRSATGHLDISITEEIIVTRADAGDGFLFNIRKSFLSGWNFMVGFFYLIIRVWPLWVFLVIGILIYSRMKRARSTQATG